MATSITNLDSMLLDMLNGMGAHEARVKNKVTNHTAGELHVFRFQWLLANLPEPGTGEWTFSRSLVCYLRFEATDDRGKKGWGIGKIMVALNASESKVRKAIREGANVSDRGHRTGKGGRFYQRDERLYTEELRETGTLISLKDERSAADQAAKQLLMKKSIEDLRAIASAAGLTTKGKTKAQLVRALTA